VAFGYHRKEQEHICIEYPNNKLIVLCVDCNQSLQQFNALAVSKWCFRFQEMHGTLLSGSK